MQGGGFHQGSSRQSLFQAANALAEAGFGNNSGNSSDSKRQTETEAEHGRREERGGHVSLCLHAMLWRRTRIHMHLCVCFVVWCVSLRIYLCAWCVWPVTDSSPVDPLTVAGGGGGSARRSIAITLPSTSEEEDDQVGIPLLICWIHLHISLHTHIHDA